VTLTAPVGPTHSHESKASGRPAPTKVARAMITFYQVMASGRPSPCRFYPSCSTYAAEAIELHGAWRGSRLAARRLLRCRPFGRHGIDLVPLPEGVTTEMERP
jgi:uncharacterized protein